jgi:NhaP-type Na+/H+ or K+/H+ antiporter
MLFMWVSTGLLVYFILGWPFWLAMLTGAILTPTDPIVASSIVTGPVAEENLPARMRHALSFESGANDGLGYPFVFLAALLLTAPAGEVLREWFLRVVLWEQGVALLFGAAAGALAGKLMVYAETHKLMDRYSLLAHTLALSLFVLGAAKLLHSNEILAVFVAGIVFDEVVSARDQAEEERIQEAVNRFFSLPIFILLGTIIPWDGWLDLGSKGAALVIAILLLRRLPVILALRRLMPGLQSVSDALIVGWFGPIAIGALFYASLIHRHLQADQIWNVATLVICASTVIHGMTATPFSLLYGRAAARSR